MNEWDYAQQICNHLDMMNSFHKWPVLYKYHTWVKQNYVLVKKNLVDATQPANVTDIELWKDVPYWDMAWKND